jgi:pimeloyl-ACP methyl ester carboxylesterase
MASTNLFRNDWIEIGYEEDGSPSDPTVILLHGFPDSPRTWDGVRAALGSQRLHLVAPYQRGFGPSRVLSHEAQGGSIAAMAQDVLDLMDGLGLSRFMVVGHDWGSRAAHAVAVLSPDRVTGIIGLATPYGLDEASANDRRRQVQAYWYQWYFHTPQGRAALEDDRRGFCRYLWRAWAPHWEPSDDEYELTATAFDNQQFVDTVIHSYCHRHGNAPDIPHYARQEALLSTMPLIPVPAVLVRGSDDTVNLPGASEGTDRYYAHGIRRLTAHGAGHFIQREQPRLIADLIRSETRSRM